MNDRNYNNYGTVIFGDVYGSTIENSNTNVDCSCTSVSINDPIVIEQLLSAAKQIQPVDSEAAKKAKELQEELKAESPKVGKIQALYDWLRRNCTVENTLKAIKVFGSLMIQLLK